MLLRIVVTSNSKENTLPPGGGRVRDGGWKKYLNPTPALTPTTHKTLPINAYERSKNEKSGQKDRIFQFGSPKLAII
jgi:hypothetical protein